jgi:hypothetical protein
MHLTHAPMHIVHTHMLQTYGNAEKFRALVQRGDANELMAVYQMLQEQVVFLALTSSLCVCVCLSVCLSICLFVCLVYDVNELKRLIR